MQWRSNLLYAAVGGAVVLGVGAAVRYLRGRPPIVPAADEAKFRLWQGEDDEAPVRVLPDGSLFDRMGVCLRLAKEVKLRFGGTPSRSPANKLLAARYIKDAFDAHGVTRELDRAKLMYKVRALVFLPSPEEIEEAKFMASYAYAEQVKEFTKWRSPLEMDGYSFGAMAQRAVGKVGLALVNAAAGVQWLIRRRPRLPEPEMPSAPTVPAVGAGEIAFGEFVVPTSGSSE